MLSYYQLMSEMRSCCCERQIKPSRLLSEYEKEKEQVDSSRQADFKLKTQSSNIGNSSKEFNLGSETEFETPIIICEVNEPNSFVPNYEKMLEQQMRPLPKQEQDTIDQLYLAGKSGQNEFKDELFKLNQVHCDKDQHSFDRSSYKDYLKNKNSKKTSRLDSTILSNKSSLQNPSLTNSSNLTISKVSPLPNKLKQSQQQQQKESFVDQKSVVNLTKSDAVRVESCNLSQLSIGKDLIEEDLLETMDRIEELNPNHSQDFIYQRPSLRNQRQASRMSLKSSLNSSSMLNTTKKHDLNSQGAQVIDDFESDCSDYHHQIKYSENSQVRYSKALDNVKMVVNKYINKSPQNSGSIKNSSSCNNISFLSYNTQGLQQLDDFNSITDSSVSD